MVSLTIRGGHPLSGEVDVFGSKNASLFIMAAALLANGESELLHAPDVIDVRNLSLAFAELGVMVEFKASSIVINTVGFDGMSVTPQTAERLRASILILGPLLARRGRARIGLPGGCRIGPRPIDQHIKALEAMGASVWFEEGYLIAQASTGLHGTETTFNMTTVTGTINLILAASLATGETTLINAALEPEVEDFCKCVNSMGGNIKGLGTSRITIHGQKSLQPYKYMVMKDRIECGTLLVAGALAGNHFKINGVNKEHQYALMECLSAMGVRIRNECDNSVTIWKSSGLAATNICTGPYPGFPTDLQPQIMALLAIANGQSTVTESIFPKRFLHAIGLSALGAQVRVEKECATITGVPSLKCSVVDATDLRAAACLVLAALVAEGDTVIRGIDRTLDRGYERLDLKLVRLGASIIRIRDDSALYSPMSERNLPNNVPAAFRKDGPGRTIDQGTQNSISVIWNCSHMLEEQVDLSLHNTFAVSSVARYFVSVNCEKEVMALIDSGILQWHKHLIIGGGSNILFANSIFDGIIIKNQIHGTNIISETNEDIVIEVGAGMSWHEFTKYCVMNEYGGAECLSMIPGTVGAAAAQNIGAYGAQISDITLEVKTIDLLTAKRRTFRTSECGFGYRQSTFLVSENSGQRMITSVVFKLTKTPYKLERISTQVLEILELPGVLTPTIRSISDAVCLIRQSKLPSPKLLGNAGSFFKNPYIGEDLLRSILAKAPTLPHRLQSNLYVIPAAWLIEYCGWKGKRVGNVGIYVHHALILVNYGGGTGKEILNLSQCIRDMVLGEFGIELIPEVNIINEL